MDKLLELLKQIHELAGVGVDALEKAVGGERGQPGDESRPGGEPPAEARGEGGPPQEMQPR